MSRPRHLIREYGEKMRRLGRLDTLEGGAREESGYRKIEREAGDLLHQILICCRDFPITPEQSAALAQGNED